LRQEEVLESAVASIREALNSFAAMEAPVPCAVHTQPRTRLVYIAAAIKAAAWDRLNAAFVDAQRRGGVDKVHKAKEELHLTLWHRSDAGKGGTPREEYEKVAGKAVGVVVKGFDWADNMAAARVELQGIGEGWNRDRPFHVTMWVSEGIKPVEAGYLYAKSEQPGSGVRFLPLEEELIVQATVELR
jgi:hypothetical protein